MLIEYKSYSDYELKRLFKKVSSNAHIDYLKEFEFLYLYIFELENENYYSKYNYDEILRENQKLEDDIKYIKYENQKLVEHANKFKEVANKCQRWIYDRTGEIIS